MNKLPMKSVIQPRSPSATFAALIAIVASLCVVSRAHAQETDTWTGNGSDTTWTNSGNWTYSNGGTSPAAGDSLVFVGSHTANNNNFANGTGFGGITFGPGASSFTLSGNSVLLTGQTNGNIVGIVNNSAAAQTAGLGLSLDWGYYTFDSPAGSLALGTLTRNAGSVAYFDNNVSSSLSSDTSGLISGCGGAALMYNDALTTNGYEFTGLASIGGGGAIVTYSAFPSVLSTPGLFGATTAASAVNVEITGDAGGSYTLANGSGTTYANTVFLSAAQGGSFALAGAAGTLDVGAVSGVGGFYLPAGNIAQALTIGSGSSTILTAGTASGSPGTMVFAINGFTNTSQAYVNSKIANNGSGAVTVIMAGNGATSFGNIANTYSGGTYLAQGQLEASNTASFGSGPVYVASGASAVTELSGSSTMSTTFYLSPGYGSPLNPFSGALVNGGSGNSSTFTYSGTINLLGAPVTAPPGDRVVETGFGAIGYATGLGVAFTGPATGPGTLDLYAAQSMFFILKYSGVNSYQGGTIIESGPGAYNMTRTGVNNQIPNGPGMGNMMIVNNGPNNGTNGLARFDVNGHTQTINGLIAPNNGYTSGQAVGNFQANGESSAGTLTLGANGNNNGGPFTFYGVLQDQGIAHPTFGFNLIKIGNGTQILAGPNPNTYIGSTTVSNGTLALAQGAAIPNSSNIYIFPGATLDVSALSAPFDVALATSVGNAQVLNCIGTINGGTNTTILDGWLNPFASRIGTCTVMGSLVLDSAATYIWDMNNASGTAGSDPGWGLVSVQGAVTINANSGDPFILKIVSLNGEAAGNAANFNPSLARTWTLLQSSTAITGFDPTAFTLDTTGFGNNLGGGSFSLQLSGDQKSVLLAFTPAASICMALQNQTNAIGTTAQFTVGVCADAQPATYQWYWNSTPVSDGNPSGSGSTINIVSTGSSSTLTITNVGDGDAGTYSVAVTGTIGGTPTTSATLTIVDPPSGPYVTESSPMGVTLSGGGVNYLTAAASAGTPPYTYVWYFDGVPVANGGPFSGANTATLGVALVAGTVGTYTVVIANAAGSVTNEQIVLPYVTQVPNQYIYDSFDAYTPQNWEGSPGVAPNPPSWEGVTNLYNQATGEPAYWYNPSGFGTANSEMVVRNNTLYTSTRNGGAYPWPGLASDSSQAPYGSFNQLDWMGGEQIGNTTDNHLHFTSQSFPPGSKIYFSFIFNADNLNGNPLASLGADLFFGLGGTGTDFTYKLASEVTTDETDPQELFSLGLFKGDGANISTTEPYGAWATNVTYLGEDIFIVGCYTVVSGGTNATDDTVALWINPATNTFYASEADVPPPSLGPSGFGAKNGPVNEIIVRNTGLITFYNVSDLRIGSTWASVTPPSGPTLSLANQSIANGQTAVFASQNAGNPVNSYAWQFNGGAPLTDNTPNPDGSYYLGSSTATLTIVNAQHAELGTYTVTGGNSDLYGNTFTGTASATLSLARPTLSITTSGANALITWPTNFAGFGLEEAGSLAPPPTWTAVPANQITIVGTNNTATINAGTGNTFFRLQSPAP